MCENTFWAFISDHYIVAIILAIIAGSVLRAPFDVMRLFLNKLAEDRPHD